MDDNKKKNKLAGYSWFAFDVIDWLTSENVNRMTVAERGVYITLLAVQWRDGSLPDDCKLAARLSGLDVRIYKKWLSVWGFLFPRMQDCGKLANEKLWKLSVAVGKQAAAASLEERREEKKEESKRGSAASGGASSDPLAPTPQEATPPAPSESALPFDPRTCFSSGTPEFVAVHYWLESDDDFWRKKFRDEATLRKHISAMVKQQRQSDPGYAPTVEQPYRKFDPACPVCDGDGQDQRLWPRVCACVRCFDKAGKEYSLYDSYFIGAPEGDLMAIGTREFFEAQRAKTVQRAMNVPVPLAAASTG